MKRLAKPLGQFNVVLEEVPMPEAGTGEVRIRAVRSLISRGSEIGGRYSRVEAIDPDRMGYSLAGVVDGVGPEVTHFRVGGRVVALAPHAQFVVRSARVASPREFAWVVPLPEGISFDQAPYYPLLSGAVAWVKMEQAHPGDVVAIVGQGLVGSLMLQVLLATSRARVIAIDALENRCELAAKLGAHEVINARIQDPVQAVKRATNGIGADIVAYAVGGPAGLKAFDQGLDMLASGGLMHLIGLYEDGPLPLSSSKIQGKRLIGGYVGETVTAQTSRLAIDLLVAGAIRTDLLTTHRFCYGSAGEAYDLLYSRPGDALGVLLDWET